MGKQIRKAKRVFLATYSASSLCVGAIAGLLLIAACSYGEGEGKGGDVIQSAQNERPDQKKEISRGASRDSIAGLVEVDFVSLSKTNDLTLSIIMRGDPDGETILATEQCCGKDSSKSVIRDVHVFSRGRSLAIERTKLGWRVLHQPSATIQVSYSLSSTGPGIIDAGVSVQLRPVVYDGYFHLVGSSSLLLPIGRKSLEKINLRLVVSSEIQKGTFVSSFGRGSSVTDVDTTWSDLRRSIFLGGSQSVVIHDTGRGIVGISYSGLKSRAHADLIEKDVLEIVNAQRIFFHDQQPWYLVSVQGGRTNDQKMIVGGGVGMHDSFAMFVNTDMDLSDSEHREHFRWVLAHEYFHSWNGLTLRVASKNGSDQDDTSVYWFSEGFTEFYAMRLLTRAGMQSSTRAVDVLNDKLRRYAGNKRRGLGAKKVGSLFWTDVDGEQIPYLRGYLAAWVVDIGSMKAAHGEPRLDTVMRELVGRAKEDPTFKVDNEYLMNAFSKVLSEADAQSLNRFIRFGGKPPLGPDSFSPCLTGREVRGESVTSLQFNFKDDAHSGCFRH